MRRQRRGHHYADENFRSSYNRSNGYVDDFLQMESMNTNLQLSQHKFENTIEAKVQEGDTLQALALRFHCTVADIKRLNKIDKENEIYARKVVKIPVTAHSVLLDSLPTVHKSGNSSPKHNSFSDRLESNSVRDPLHNAKIILEEKLLVASVNAASTPIMAAVNGTTNSVGLKQGTKAFGLDEDRQPASGSDISTDVTSPLLSDLLDESVPHPRPIRGPALSAIEWSGSDCDMSWVCLFIVILALCFVIPLLYIIYLAEHPHHHNTTTH